MTKVYSFDVSGDFAVFRDPSVTTAQTTYTAPSKTHIIGLLGALIGVGRSKTKNEIFSDGFKDLYKKTLVGIEVLSEIPPERVSFVTNHRSLKKSKKSVTKPFRAEFLREPRFRIYYATNDEYAEKIQDAMMKNSFFYTPYLGHAFCLARISNFRESDSKDLSEKAKHEIKCVFADRDGREPSYTVSTTGGSGSTIVERHLHQFFGDENQKKAILKYYIPVGCELTLQKRKKTDFVVFRSLEDKVVCLF